jgi:hypothetical protein
MVYLETFDAATPGTPPVVLLQHLERMKSIEFANQYLKGEVIGHIAGLGDQLISYKGTINNAAFSTAIVELADLITGQSLSPLLGHDVSSRSLAVATGS